MHRFEGGDEDSECHRRVIGGVVPEYRKFHPGGPRVEEEDEAVAEGAEGPHVAVAREYSIRPLAVSLGVLPVEETGHLER